MAVIVGWNGHVRMTRTNVRKLGHPSPTFVLVLFYTVAWLGKLEPYLEINIQHDRLVIAHRDLICARKIGRIDHRGTQCLDRLQSLFEYHVDEWVVSCDAVVEEYATWDSNAFPFESVGVEGFGEVGYGCGLSEGEVVVRVGTGDDREDYSGV